MKNRVYKRIILLGLSLFCVAFVGCRKEKPVEGKRAGAGVIRLESLLGQSSTKFQGGFEMTPENFAEFQGNGWEVNKDSVTAILKRAVLILPNVPDEVNGAFLRFRANQPADVSSRRLVIQSKEKELAAVNLITGWHDYQIALKPHEMKRLRFVFEGRKSADQTFGDFSNFELQYYGHGPVKIQNELRPSILIPASGSVSFSVNVPAGKPFLFVGAGLQGEEQERSYSVHAQQENSSKKLSEFSVSSSQWRDTEIDLSAYAGKNVRLELKPESQKATNGVIAWSNPEILDVSAKKDGLNVILFSIDALRPDHLSYYGYPIKTSPNLDAFARASIVFDNAHCTSPSTLPSHTSVVTGLYPSNHQVGKKTKMIPRLQRIPDKLVTLAELLSQQDYRTAAITDNGYMSSFYGFQQGFQQYVENNDVEKNEVVSTIDDGIAWLKKNRTRPFFLFLHSYEVHEPFTPPLSAFRHLFPDYKLKDDKSPEIYNEWLKDVMTGKVIPTEEEKDLVRKAFDAEIYFFDQQFGKFWKELQNLQLDKNTIIVIISDHGQAFFDRGTDFGHANTLFAEEIRVPLFVFVPGKAHQQNRQLASLVDVYPTIASLLKIKKTPSVDGIDLLDPSGKQFANRRIYYEIHYADKAIWGMQNHEYKMIVDSEKGEYFFDVRKDPREMKDLKSLSPRAMNIMKGLLSTYIAQSTAPPKFRETPTDSKEAAELNERLRALGYLN